MTNHPTHSLSYEAEPIQTALAILGSADRDLLHAFLDRPLDETALSILIQSDQILEEGRILLLAQPKASSRLEALEQQDFLHYLALHERALHLLGERLREKAKESSVEPFVALLGRLAERLLNQDPQRLVVLIGSLHTLPLEGHAGHWRTLYEAIALRNLEKYGEARVLLDGLLAEANLDREIGGRALNARAICDFLLGHLQRALDGYYASLHLWQEVGNIVQEGLVLLNIGITAYELHRFEEAEQTLRRSEACLRHAQAWTWLASVQNELGLVYRDLGRWSQSIACFTHCLERRRAEGALSSAAVALSNLGEVYFFQGNWQAAAAAFDEALVNMTTQVFRVDTLLNQGLVCQVQGNFTEAKSWFVQAKTLAQAIDRRDILPTIHYRLADLLARTDAPGGAAQALAHLHQGIEQIEATRAPLRDEGIKMSLLGRWQQIYERAVLMHLAQQETAPAFAYVEQARARAFLDLLVGSEDVAAALEEPLSAEEVAARLPPETALVEFFATGQPGTSEALLANLPAESRLLREALLAPERLLAFVVTPNGVHAVQLDITATQIQAQHFHRSDGRLRGTQPLAGQPLPSTRRWHDLGARLLHPLQPFLAGVRHLYLVPHHLLHYLPLHALVDLEQLTGVRGVTASYGPSASVLWKAGRVRPRQPEGLALAIGVDTGALTHAQAEARWVAHRLQGEALLGAEATPQRVRSALADRSVIHFSCHGLFRQRSPMQSALVIAGGELTALDLLQSVRLNAEIVTLSACDTGLNQLAPGDELMGLTRAFLGSGARSLLVALWPVHEIPTRLFMEHFYESWLGGSSKAAAVVAAQRALVAIDGESLRRWLADYGLAATAAATTLDLFAQMLPGPHPFAHPYYWAAFCLVGDPG